MTIKLFHSMQGMEGKKISLLIDGELCQRRVYFKRDCGLYIVIHNKAFFEFELIEGEFFFYDESIYEMTTNDLKVRREVIAYKNRKEYQRYGNTERCQELFKELEAIDAELESRKSKARRIVIKAKAIDI